MATYKIASVEGAERYGGEVGDAVDLDLDAGEHLAVTCAGWLEPTTKKAQAPKEDK